MKYLLKSLIYVCLFLLCLVYFLPKEKLYFLLEKEFVKQNIVLDNEIIDEKSFSLNIKGIDVYYDGIALGFLNKAKIESYFFYTKIDISNARLMKEFENNFPIQIDSINIKHSILDPLYIDIKANSQKYGDVKGNVDLINRKINLIIDAKSITKTKYRNLLGNLKLEKGGKYLYEFKF